MRVGLLLVMWLLFLLPLLGHGKDVINGHACDLLGCCLGRRRARMVHARWHDIVYVVRLGLQLHGVTIELIVGVLMMVV